MNKDPHITTVKEIHVVTVREIMNQWSEGLLTARQAFSKIAAEVTEYQEISTEEEV